MCAYAFCVVERTKRTPFFYKASRKPREEEEEEEEEETTSDDDFDDDDFVEQSRPIFTPAIFGEEKEGSR